MSEVTVIAITGASAGVGRATVRRFARRGARIALIARGRERLEAAAARSRRSGGRLSSCRSTWPTQTRSRTPPGRSRSARAARHLGEQRDGDRLRAGRRDHGRRDPPRDRGHLPRLRLRNARRPAADAPRDRGTIVQVGSALAYRSIPLQAAYCAAKHAIHGFTQSLRSELLHDGARCRSRGAAPGAQHAAVRLGPQPKLPRHAAAGAADLPARGRRQGDRVGRHAPPPRGERRLARGPGDLRRPDRARPPRPLSGPSGFDGQQTDESLDGEREGNLFEPVPETSRRTAASTTVREAVAGCSRRASTVAHCCWRQPPSGSLPAVTSEIPLTWAELTSCLGDGVSGARHSRTLSGRPSSVMW